MTPTEPAPSRIAAVHEALGLKRSDKWPEVERAFRAANPTCAACTSTAVQVHHVLPFHFAILLGRPDLELDPRNLITLCETEKAMPGEDVMDHHLLLGHLDNFESYNEDVRLMVLQYVNEDEAKIKAAADWLNASQHKPKVWAQMTHADKIVMRGFMDSLYPLAPMAGASMPLTFADKSSMDIYYNPGASDAAWDEEG